MAGFGLQAASSTYRATGTFGTVAEVFRPLFESTGFTARPGIHKQLAPFLPYFPNIKQAPGPKLSPIKAKVDGRKAVVCFSGGKDSTAVIARLKATGHDVTAYYVAGANTKSLTGEMLQCERVADLLGVPLAVGRLETTGPYPPGENKLKNQMILAMAIDYGIERGAGLYACGNCMEDWLHVGHEAEAKDAGTRDWTFTDTMDLFVAAKQVFEELVPGITVAIDLLPTKAHSFFYAVDHAPATLLHSGGCVLPPFRRPNPRKANIRKYGEAVLLPGQCGSCYKCCCEYIFYAKLGGLPMQEDFYKRCCTIADIHFNILTDWTGKAPSDTFSDGIFKGRRLAPKWLQK